MVCDFDFDFYLARVLGHSVVYEASAVLRWDGIASGYFRNDLTPSAPPARDIGQETRDTLQAQVDLAPKQLAAAQHA